MFALQFLHFSYKLQSSNPWRKHMTILQNIWISLITNHFLEQEKMKIYSWTPNNLNKSLKLLSLCMTFVSHFAGSLRILWSKWPETSNVPCNRRKRDKQKETPNYKCNRTFISHCSFRDIIAWTSNVSRMTACQKFPYLLCEKPVAVVLCFYTYVSTMGTRFLSRG
jgi:hypothetical protein